MLISEPRTPLDAAPLALLYHENSKLDLGTRYELATSVAAFAGDLFEVRRSMSATKTYPGAARIDLVEQSRGTTPIGTLESLLARRRSVRQFSERPVPLSCLAKLLELAYGITGELPRGDSTSIAQAVRAAPSGGALYPTEIYVIANSIAGILPGTYHYHPNAHCLETIRLGPVESDLKNALVNMPDAPFHLPALLVLTGRWERTLLKYGERGYRILLLEIGHVAQNLLLLATSLGLDACPLAAFDDDRLAALLGVDPVVEPVLYAVEVGVSKE